LSVIKRRPGKSIISLLLFSQTQLPSQGYMVTCSVSSCRCLLFLNIITVQLSPYDGQDFMHKGLEFMSVLLCQFLILCHQASGIEAKDRCFQLGYDDLHY
jgi:hypothetical protein